MRRLTVSALGPIRQADIVWGDLTVFVGPQATGKSILLQLAKLLVDYRPIREEMRRFNLDWRGRLESFLELYWGEGMSGIYSESETQIQVDGEPKKLSSLLTARGQEHERVFYIPAQRVLALREGLTRPFTDYRAGDPFVVREFSEKLHQMVQSEFPLPEESSPQEFRELFPQPLPRRLKSEYRDLLNQHIFAGFGLVAETRQLERRLVLRGPAGQSLPFLVWSAGQREFVPLLLGLYWLIPPAKIQRRAQIEWVVIEEPEMGLHPAAIVAVIVLVLELLGRGYRVSISTHSPVVLDALWALQIVQKHKGVAGDVLKLFSLPARKPLKELASDVMKKTYRVYYFKRDGSVVNITGLDPGSESVDEAEWGGLTRFSGLAGDVVADVIRRAETASEGEP
ncbi:MAG: AAA family ATPase [Anaerolineae bacterium]|nr:AAA family ATPase [Anaerolineae bacterium]